MPKAERSRAKRAPRNTPFFNILQQIATRVPDLIVSVAKMVVDILDPNPTHTDTQP